MRFDEEVDVCGVDCRLSTVDFDVIMFVLFYDVCCELR